MKRQFPMPLKIDCSGLSQKSINDLADRLRLHFFDVDVFSDTIYAAKPVNQLRYEKAWRILDLFAVNVS